MASISKLTLPSGNVYEIKDAVARDLIAGGVNFIIAWDGSAAPDVTKIPQGLVVTYNGTSYTGTLSPDAGVKGSFYLVKSSTQTEVLDVYDEYTIVGTTPQWEKLGDTKLDLSDLGVLAYKDNVSLSKQTATALTGVKVTTQPTVTISGTATDKVLGASTTFTLTQPTISVTPSTTNIKATASGTAVGANGTIGAITELGTPTTDTFVKSVSAETGNKLVTTTIPNVTGNTNVSIPNVTGNTNVSIPNVTSVGAASTWNFAMGSGDDAETLIISGGNGTAPTLGTALSASKVTLGTALSASKVTLGTAKTAATGAVSASGTGAAIVTDVTVGDSASAITALGTPSTTNVLTGVKVTTQPTISIASGSGTGSYSVVTGISAATATGGAVNVGTNDNVDAVTDVGNATASGTAVGADGTATVLTNATSVTVS